MEVSAWSESSAMRAIKGRGFSRYHASRQANFDVKGTSFGCLMYLAAFYNVWNTTGKFISALPALALGVLTLWPAALLSFYPGAYLTYRDPLFIVHFFLHHSIAPQILIPLGVDVRDTMASTQSPHLFFMGLLLSRGLLWHALNSLMYRMKLKSFMYSQPLILAAALPMEIEICEWGAKEHVDIAYAAFGTLRNGLGLLAAAGAPGWRSRISGASSLTATVAVGDNRHHAEAYTSCLQVHIFLLVMLGYFLPACIIWFLENATWQDFLQEDPEKLAWVGGPSMEQLTAGLQRLRTEEAERRVHVQLDCRLVAAVILMAVTVWFSIEMAVT